MMWQPVWATRCPRLEKLGSRKNLSDFDVGVFSRQVRRQAKEAQASIRFDVAFVAVFSASYSDEAVQVLTKLRALHAERE